MIDCQYCSRNDLVGVLLLLSGVVSGNEKKFGSSKFKADAKLPGTLEVTTDEMVEQILYLFQHTFHIL